MSGSEIGAYPGVSKADLEVAKNYSSPFLLGPPMCDELIELVRHMLTGEEAEVIQHLKPWRVRTAAGLARASGRPLSEVKAILHGLAHEKYIIASYGNGKERELFAMMPVIPGTFESVLVRISPESVTPWHRRFAELHEALFSTGFTVKYVQKPIDSVRYLPVGEAIQNEPMALPSDRLGEILDRYNDFAVGVCQCRLAKRLTDGGCGRTLEVCTVMGTLAPHLVDQGRMRKVSRNEVLEIKTAAEKEGLVTWMMNEESGKFTSASCSCCGCCCGALRTISEFNTPGFIAPPHFMPHVDSVNCKLCGKCAEACPMKAVLVLGEGEQKRLLYKHERCIGCGLCAVACPKGNVTMQPVPDYRQPPGGWPSYLAKYLPRHLSNMLSVRSSRRQQERNA